MTSRRVFRTLSLLVVFRVWNAVNVTTFFSPDEFWQALEIAYLLVFKYGHMTWEWLPGLQLRGFAHPMYFAAGYSALSYFDVASTPLLIALPKIQQGIVAAFADFFTWRLANVLFGPKIAQWTLFASLLSWFNFFVLPRALSNSMEAAFFAASLYFWHRKPAKYLISIVFMGLTILLRPTSAPIFAMHMAFSPPPRHRAWPFLIQLVLVGVLFLAGSILVDDWGYQTLYTTKHLVAPPSSRYPFVAWNFVKFNVQHGIASYYGEHPWHWYLTNALPTLLGPYLLLVPLVARAWISHPVVGRVTAGTVLMYSFLPHKEFRFLACIFPLLLIAVGMALAVLNTKQLAWPLPHPPAGILVRAAHRRVTRFSTMATLAVTSFALAIYTARVHQRGVIDVMYYLRAQIAAQPDTTSIYFLMPCHSTPLYSYLGRNVRTGWLTCEPPVFMDAAARAEYLDEDRAFYARIEPSLKEWNWRDRWASTALGTSTAAGTAGVPAGAAVADVPASHVVVFNDLYRVHNATGVLAEYGECARFFNSHVHDDARRRGDVVVLCRQ
ncbi:hypothetical protein AMAG_00625 [Allomyces macrogynus ATCC 38327]|uniref:Mannosyltransferase n=1 Tax=Allomyces macrogynus (strain ATCC 38327) TaxID=578462 RepID=A0A0L0RW94_ALLM3|nr:hypothetical protein AMAG_00625 [Allomyces macrogynus ATCC 38327]|eukprot:KNE54667.1 hypothetical protein AMAG_00625 [Allomyces macrogynus ATCC 38327]